MLDDRRLCEAFDLLSAGDRSLLWHWLVEGDSVREIAAVSGVDVDKVAARLMLTHRNLRRMRTDIHLARSECADCLKAAGGITRLVYGTWSPEDFQGLALCRECQYLYDDITNLNDWLMHHLPARLLGWWPGDEYERNKIEARRTGNRPTRRTPPRRKATVRSERRAPRHKRRPAWCPERRSPNGPAPRHARRPGKALRYRLGRAVGVAVGAFAQGRRARQGAARSR
ncbi:hypothetical protein [Streptomyces collinus]|uniref:hypothetical protein n=1 Tax=Streptomyces collinus TaxID=42684 RepID=UPI0036A980CC